MQQKQKRRLKHFAKKFERDREYLMNKVNHAALMDTVMKIAMVDTTTQLYLLFYVSLSF